MKYYVYVLLSYNSKLKYTYVGWTNNIKKRVASHNLGSGAKFTRGKKWTLIHLETYSSKKMAMSREYNLKKDRKYRNLLKNKFESMINT